jgi:hypothetical protein
MKLRELGDARMDFKMACPWTSRYKEPSWSPLTEQYHTHQHSQPITRNLNVYLTSIQHGEHSYSLQEGRLRE